MRRPWPTGGLSRQKENQYKMKSKIVPVHSIILAVGGISSPLQGTVFAAVGKTPSVSTELETIVNNT